MKTRSKITLRTKIYLTIAGFLALTGVFYAANPSPFVTGLFQPVSVAADPAHLFASGFQSGIIFTIDCPGSVSLFGTLPAGDNANTEKYMAIAPAESAMALFTPGDLFVTRREQIYTATPPNGNFTQFADLSGVLGGCPLSDGTGITFDHEGTFGFNMILTCENGRVWKVDHNGTVTHIADTTDLQHNTHIEGPAVMPPSMGPLLAGQILVADDFHHQIYAIDNLGNVNYDPFVPGLVNFFFGAEQVIVIPESLCTFCPGPFFHASTVDSTIYSFPLSDFAGLGGDILITSENGAGTDRVHWDGTNFVRSPFDTSQIQVEGSAFVERPCEQCNLTVTHRRSFGNTVQIFLNSGSTDQFITNLALSWPQGINGKLTQIKLDGVVLWNGPAANSPINFGVPPLVMNPHKRKIAHNSTEVLKFIFQNNAAPLNNPVYNGSATFESGCSLDFGLPTRRPR